jgi:hypothetical protein
MHVNIGRRADSIQWGRREGRKEGRGGEERGGEGRKEGQMTLSSIKEAFLQLVILNRDRIS